MAGEPHPRSLNGRISKLQVGDREYIEATLTQWPDIQRRATARSRYPASMQGMAFTCSLFTAIGASKVSDIRYLVCVERIV